ncbi:MAG: ABC transporter ATP-binding protein/permease [Defluviitaleaceae bacterium]|nr:ABC transporter ATP-binding protein/permease [Defluviitaleaceae bacterium]
MFKKILKAHWRILFVFVILSVISGAMFSGANIFRQIIIDALIGGDTGRFVRFIVYGLVFIFVTGIIYFLTELAGQKFKVNYKQAMRQGAYGGIMRRNALDFESKDTGEYISCMTNDINIINGSFLSPLLMLIRPVTSVVSAIIIMLLYSPLLTLVALGCALLSIFVPIIFSNPIQKAQVKVSKANTSFTVALKELLNGFSVISSFNIFSQAKKRFDKVNNELAQSEFRHEKISSGATSTSQMIGVVSGFAMLAVSGVLVLNDVITIGDLVLFSGLSGALSSGAVMSMQLVPYIRSAKPILAAFSEITDYQDESFVGTGSPCFNKSILVKDLSFEYNENTPILSNLSFELKKNEKVALIGSSGGGKTTLIKLLCGKYATYSGEIFYDNDEIKALDNMQLRKLIAIIPQHVYIFNETIHYNICLGEDFSDDDLNRAVQLSGVNKFLPQMPSGIDTGCGEGGNNLSGGQKQRIALARALIRGIDFLILDEGVSAIDVETANEIEQELLNKNELTLLTITHRIKDGLIDSYDRVVRLDNGMLSNFQRSQL